MGSWRFALAVAGTVLVGAPLAEGRIAETRHNLTATGPGPVKAPGTLELCKFCHTPHRASQTRALWNRDLPPVTYKLYTSSTLTTTTLKQPTGASRLCLSCHDGTAALGAIRVPPVSGPVALGPLTGPAALGTDLSDDHPVSLVYDRDLATQRGQMVDPGQLPPSIRLDDTGQLQCTTCHEPHDNPYRKFLRVDDKGGGLCLNCHQPTSWVGSTHATTEATWNGNGTNPWPATPYTKVADNACENCHRPHSAPRPPRLLSSAQERSVCLVCHTGNVASANIGAQFTKFSAHPVDSTDWTHEPLEDPVTMARHVTCVDCHNPHQVVSTQASPPAVPGRLRGVRGVSVSGALVTTAVNEYEVCLKCHGLADQATTPAIVRQDNIRNIRLKIDPSNPSYHPVAAAGKNSTIISLRPPYTASSLIYCTDCHNHDQPSPRGPHGSSFEPILEQAFDIQDPGSGFTSSYALCFKCHSEPALFSTRFPHDKHIVDARAGCAVCHDVHGSRQKSRLINFMLRDKGGQVVVGPSASGRLEFIQDSARPDRGECFLNCHGKEHDPRGY